MKYLTTFSLLALIAAGCAQTPAPAPTPEDDRARCAAALQRFRLALATAAEGCLHDEGCVAWGSCHAVIRDHGGQATAAQEQARQACRAVPESRVETECTPRPVRCVARRCLRF